MDPTQFRFDDGASYEAYMGTWSRLAGDVFVRWLAPDDGWRWVDVGCGNGAFTEMLFDRCGAREVDGIDPSDGQLAYARTRLAGRSARFRRGEAGALPYADGAFDAAVMALVIFFVPEPAQGVAEMARVVRPGGSVSAYAWDIAGGGFPFAALQDALRAIGLTPLYPPSVDAARLDALRALWAGAGLVDVRTDVVRVQRTFDDFDQYFAIAKTGPRIAPAIASMSPDAVAVFRERLRERVAVDAQGRVVVDGAANAIAGRVPG